MNLMIMLRLMILIANSVILVSYIGTFNWIKYKLPGNSSMLRFFTNRTLLFILSVAMLVFYHILAELLIASSTEKIGYTWIYMNVQIVTLYYAVAGLAPYRKRYFLGLEVLMAAWYMHMPGFFENSLLVAQWGSATIVLWGVYRYATFLLKHFHCFLGTLFIVAIPFWWSNDIFLNGINVGWLWEVLSLGFVGALVYIVNRIWVSESNKKLKLEHDVNFDGLTNLRNFRIFNNNLHDAFNQETPVMLYTFDIDNFKCINDQYGHLVGNQVLKQVAEELDKFVADYEYPGQAYRIGGEEFGLIMYQGELSVEAMTKCALRLSDTLSRIRFKAENTDFYITISIGADHNRQSDQSYLEVYRRADEYLYIAKNNGRNQGVLKGEIVPFLDDKDNSRAMGEM